MVPDVENVPVERVTANLERMVQEQPKNLDLRLNLARAHAMAFAQKVEVLSVYKIGAVAGQAFFNYEPNYRQFVVVKPANPQVAAVAETHLKAAIDAYRELLKINPDHVLGNLGLGWALYCSDDSAHAKTYFRKVIELEWPRESQTSSVWMSGSLVEEAMRYLRPLLDPKADAAEIDALNERKAVLDKKGRMITPIAIPLRSGLSALDITDETASVLFDADGSGIPRQWTWITKDAAWLVFDKKDTGHITSALQWFGNVTFWMFWDNGYDALRTLDDNGDGVIGRNEFAGLALWHDRDGDGVSRRDEVRPLADYGIVELSTRYEHDATHPDEIAWSPSGVTFRDGQVRPTFDLVLRTSRSVITSR
jgi:tetratricopeptide (TPR) repeat protein